MPTIDNKTTGDSLYNYFDVQSQSPLIPFKTDPMFNGYSETPKEHREAANKLFERRITAVALCAISAIAGICSLILFHEFTVKPLMILGMTAVSLGFFAVASVTTALILLTIKTEPAKGLLLRRPLQLKQNQLEKDKMQLEIIPESRQQVLLKKWAEKSIAEIVDDPDFEESLGKEFSADYWKEKALKETQQMAVVDIASKMPILFSKGILQAQDALSGHKSISERLNAEVKNYNGLKELMGWPSFLFTHKIIDRNHLHIQVLIKNFIMINLQNSFTNLWVGEDAKIYEFIVQHQLMSEFLSPLLKKAQEDYQQHKAIYEQNKKIVQDLYNQNLEELESQKKLKISDAEQKTGFSQAQIDVKAHIEIIQALELKIEEAKSRLANLTSEQALIFELSNKNQNLIEDLTSKVKQFNQLQMEIDLILYQKLAGELSELRKERQILLEEYDVNVAACAQVRSKFAKLLKQKEKADLLLVKSKEHLYQAAKLFQLRNEEIEQKYADNLNILDNFRDDGIGNHKSKFLKTQTYIAMQVQNGLAKIK